MATTEKYTTVIELNSEQAKRNLDELRKKVESWKSDLTEAISYVSTDYGTSLVASKAAIASINEGIMQLNEGFGAYMNGYVLSVSM